MITAILRAVAFFVAGVFVLIPLAAFAQEAASAIPVKWEYRVLSRDQIAELGKNDLAAGLNRLGEHGWQLVTVEPAFTPEKNSTVPARAAQYYLIRPKDYPHPARDCPKAGRVGQGRPGDVRGPGGLVRTDGQERLPHRDTSPG